MQKTTLEKVLCSNSSTKQRAPHSQSNIVTDIKTVLKLYRHKQKIYINQFVPVTSSKRHKCFKCPTCKSKDNVKRMIFALEPGWFTHQRAYGYSSHSQVSMTVESGCLRL